MDHPSASKTRIITLGNKTFHSKSEMHAFFSEILHAKVQDFPAPVDTKHFSVFLDLLKQGHTNFKEKIGVGVKNFLIGIHPKFSNRCFFIERVDNTQEDFSYMKCFDTLFPGEKDQKKRSFDETKLQKVPNAIVQIKGIDKTKCNWKQLKEHFQTFGEVKYLDVSDSGEALIRFGSSNDAASALEELKTNNSIPFESANLVQGEEEEKYWEKLWATMKNKKPRFNNGNTKKKFPSRGKPKGFKAKEHNSVPQPVDTGIPEVKASLTKT